MSIRLWSFLAWFVVGALSAAPAAQTWQLKRSVWNERDLSVVSDTVRQRVVALGEPPSILVSDTWEWNGSQWSACVPLGPSPRYRYSDAMAYDEARQEVLLFGGPTGGETWTWDGVAWRQLTPASSPPPRKRHVMAYDRRRQRVVLFGGFGFTDTWEWNGSTWTQVVTSRVPPFTRGSMVYDDARGEMVLFGGSDPVGGETWLYDGIEWRQAAVTLRPPGRSDAGMAWDAVRQRVVLLGGFPVNLDRTWEWDGQSWSQRGAPTPWRMSGDTMAFDAARGRVVQMTGVGLAEWDGTTWSPVAGVPSPRGGHAMARDTLRDCTVLFGGNNFNAYSDETWEWDGFAWSLREPSRHPPALAGHGLAYDAVRQRVVLFGGRDRGGALYGGTWIWDGSDWREAGGSGAPAPRTAPLVFDAARGETVLFGGAGAGGPLGDTWIWDGTGWSLRSPAASPAPRDGHALAYDPIRRRVVLFGGKTAAGVVSDTWEWDGTTWLRRDPPVAPAARRSHAMAFHPTLGIVMHGGLDGPPAGVRVLSDAWIWDGSTWSQLTTAAPFTLYDHAIATDDQRGLLVLFGGRYSLFSGDTLALTYVMGAGHLPLAARQPLGFGCGGQGDPVLSGFGEPMLGNLGFQLAVTRGPRGSAGALWLATRQAGLVIGGGCVLWVDPITLVVRPLTTGAAGSGSVGLPIPWLTGLAGQRLYAQALLLDPASSLGVALTRGLRITLGE